MRSLSVLSLLLTLALSALTRAAAPVEPSRRNAVVRAVERAGPAIVNISTARIAQRRIDPFYAFRDRFFDEMFRDFFGHQTRKYVTNSLGSGVIVSPDGYILTNAHVVMRATKITVTLSDKRQFEADLVNIDADHDLALLKVAAKAPLPVVPVGTSSDLMIGETVIAIGNPFGLTNTVTTGVISATGRSIRADEHQVFEGLLQTDAAINPGNSGGALLNIRGDLIAINTAIRAGAEGIGFAIPADAAIGSACDLLDYRLLKRIDLGIETERSKTQIVIRSVRANSPAARAGLKKGDVIAEIDGERLLTEFCQRRLIARHKPGDRVRFTVRRGRRTRSVDVTLGEIPEPSPVDLARKKFGVVVQELDEDLAGALNLEPKSAVLIREVEAGGPAATTGLRATDAIVYLGRARIKSLRDLGHVLKSLPAKTRLSVLIVRRNRLYRAFLTTR
jgi:serine protease Do